MTEGAEKNTRSFVDALFNSVKASRQQLRIKPKNLDEQIRADQSQALIKKIETDRELKKLVCKLVFRTLWAELIFVALLTYFQGFQDNWFKLDTATFGILVNVIVLQTLLAVRYITIHLFPNNLSENKAEEENAKANPF